MRGEEIIKLGQEKFDIKFSLSFEPPTLLFPSEQIVHLHYALTRFPKKIQEYLFTKNSKYFFAIKVTP